MRALVLLLASSLTVSLMAGNALAAEISGAQVIIRRDPAAADCPDEAELVREVAGRLLAAGDRGHKPARVEVTLSKEGASYAAAIRVEGENAGVRTLKAAGSTCAPLHDALVVSLLIVFDANLPDDLGKSSPGDASSAASGSAATTTAPAPGSAPNAPPKSTASATNPANAMNATGSPGGAGSAASSAVVPGRAQRDASAGTSPLHLWISLGGSATHGLPLDFGLAAQVGVIGRVSVLDVAADFLYAPERVVVSPPGEVRVQNVAGRARACYALVPGSPGVRLGACAHVVVAALTGSGYKFDVTQTQNRVWGMGGLGADVELPVASRLAFAFEGVMLMSVYRQAFVVDGLPTPYENDLFVGWLGADVRLRIW